MEDVYASERWVKGRDQYNWDPVDFLVGKPGNVYLNAYGTYGF